ncbi:hypothetical protein FRB93_006403 [Tulasnella sp. JGI-2019a]|nr:hypothetical protein FRB93_006403 [Tulasnella sp. JGI-2019a]
MASTSPESSIDSKTVSQNAITVLEQHGGDHIAQGSDLAPLEYEPDTATATDTFNHDLESGPKEDSHVKMDVEHAAVVDDPRLWTQKRKNLNLFIISFVAIAPAIGANIYNPAFNQIKQQLHASNAEIAASLSIFILVQGSTPIIWSAISEIKGRNIVYFTSLLTFVIGCTVAALSRSIGLLIGMRTVQALGAAAALTTGSGTIADMYEPHERGARVGIYYAFPLLGPALGPILGGALVQAWNWRVTFWFMVIQGAISLLLCLLMKDSFRKERSLAYLAAKKHASSRVQSRTQSTQISRRPSRTDLKVLATKAHTDVDAAPHLDTEKADESHQAEVANGKTDFKLSLADVNPLGPVWQVMRQRSNIAILFASGCLFGFSYGICYTCAITFAEAPYSYDPLRVGGVLLSFGIGSVSGSVLGGRFSDRILARLKKANGGISRPEMRLESTKIAMFILPFFVLTYGWTTHFHVNIAVPVVMLFLSGFTLLWTNSSTLTYIVDSNPGRASTGIAMNSCFRGVTGFLVAEVSGPIRDAIGDGGLYSIWTGILFGVAALMIYTARKGASWREIEESQKLKRALEKARKTQGEESNSREA